MIVNESQSPKPHWIRRTIRWWNRNTPLWATVVAIILASTGTTFAWVADSNARHRSQQGLERDVLNNCRIRNETARVTATKVSEAEELSTHNDIEVTVELLESLDVDPDVVSQYKEARERGAKNTSEVLAEIASETRPVDCNQDAEAGDVGDFPQ
jgi:hypothetical protein